MKHTPECIPELLALGIAFDDVEALCDISTTLQHWYELECGTIWWNGGPYGETVYAVVCRDDITDKPHLQFSNNWPDRPCQDREKDAIRRLNKIMTKYPSLHYYLQTDPRGPSLYIGSEILDQCNYSSKGKAVYK